MKFRYLFAAIASSLCIFAACSQEDPVSLDSIQLDKSYLSIPAAGGSATLTVTASEPWALANNIVIGKDADKKDILAQLPTWLTASAVSGEAGKKEVTFTAEACDYGREQAFQIEVGKQLQYFIVRQGEMTIEEASIADALASPDGKSFRLTGVICEKYQNYEKYGNFYITDGTDKILIYGIADKDGKFANNPIASWGIEIGDQITIEGPRGNYKGSPQMVNCTVVELVKALLQVDKTSFDVGKDGEDIVVTATFKGNGVMVKECPDWISLTATEYVAGVPSKLDPHPADKNVLTFTVTPNGGVKPRTGEIVLESTNSDGSSEQVVTVTQAANAPDLMTIAEALQTDYAHVKGTIMAICKRGYILADATGAILCYYGNTFDATKYKLGDVMEIVNTTGHYNFGPQLSCDGKEGGFDLEEKISEGDGTVTYPTPKVLDQTALAALIASVSGQTSSLENCISVEYVQFTATPKKSGTYINLFLDGYTDADFSAYQLPASFDLESMVDKKVTVRGYTQSISGGKHVNIVFTEMVEGEAEVPTIEYTDLSAINALATGSDFELTAIVAFLTPRNDAAIVTDGTNFFYAYKPSTMPEVGDVVSISGKINVYNGLIESAEAPTLTVVEKGTLPELTPTDITATYGSFFETDKPAMYITAVGEYVVDGSYTNLVVEGSTIKGSLSGAIDAKWNGKKVRCTGYYTGGNKSKTFIYTAVTAIEEVS